MASNISQTNTLHEIVSLDDPLYDDWLDIFQKSFPLSEQILISEHNKSLRSTKAGVSRDEVYLVSMDDNKNVTGAVRTDYSQEEKAMALWYLAVDPEIRCGGIGTWLYSAALKHAARGRECRAVVFEVESPDTCHDADSRILAERRIAFYKRQGAKLFGGIRYIQSVEWQPPIPMSVMIHPFADMTPDAALTLAENVLGEEIERVGDLRMD